MPSTPDPAHWLQLRAEELSRAHARLRCRGRVWVGFSGGRDSTVLLHALRAAGIAGLGAIHVDHGLQPASRAWATDCRRKAARWGIDCRVVTADLRARGDGPEAEAREARLRAMGSVVDRGDVIALAHHRDDQVETVLQRVLRGSGPEGLSGMAVVSRIRGLRLWRPLLDCPVAALAAYAGARRLRWIEDPMNADCRYQRVAVRRRVLPAWRRIEPGVDAQILKLAANCRAIAEGLMHMGQQALIDAARGDSLRIGALMGADPLFRQQALREWTRSRGLQPLPDVVIERIEREVLGAGIDRTPSLAWDGMTIRRYREHLYLVPQLADARPGASGPLSARTALPAGAGTLQLRARRLLRERMNWAFPTGGERLRPAGDRHTRTLKQLFQSAGVPPWVRCRTPLLYLDGDLVCVPGVVSSEAFQVMQQRNECRLRWQHQLPGGQSGLAS